MLNLKKFLALLTLNYLRFWARLQLRKNPRAVTIGITGSSGKTSTRLALRLILSSVGRVKHSVHANSESGIPLNILGLHLTTYSPFDWLRVLLLAPWQYLTFRERYDYYIVEYGIDAPTPPKNMAYLLSILRPDMAIVLGTGLAHASAFDYLVKDTHPARRQEKLRALIAREKIALALALPPTGTAVLNLDDPALLPHYRSLSARRLTFGKALKADFRLGKTTLTPRGFTLRIRHATKDYTLKLPDPLGEEYAYSLVSAIALAHALGVSISRSLSALAAYRAPAGRLRHFPGIKHTHVLDSTYNANPTSMTHALKTLSHLAPHSPRLAVLGDMRELGLQGKSAHQQLARLIPRYATEAILFGPLMAEYCLPPLHRAGFPVYHAPTMPALKAYLRSRLRPGMWLLFKGSQNQLFLERAVESVLANPADAASLPRRGRFWDRLRAQTP